MATCSHEPSSWKGDGYDPTIVQFDFDSRFRLKSVDCPMQKLLLLSYHFPELNVIASQRAAAFARYLPQHGFDVTVITLDWEMVTPHAHVVAKGEGYTVTQFEQATVHRIKTPNPIENKWPSKLKIAQGWTKGEFEGEAGKAYYSLFRNHLRALLRTEKYDLLLGVFSPHHHLKLCYELHQEFGLPYHLDFRDLWSNRIAMRNYKPSPVEKIQDAFIRKHWTKWLNAAESFSITSKPWLNYLSKLTNTAGIEVRNGYISEEFEQVTPTSFDCFTVAYTGSVYLTQPLEIFLEGFAQFCVSHPHSQVVFLGSEVASKGGDPTARHTHLKELISTFLSPDQFVLTPRKPRSESLAAMLGADVLLFCAIPELSGWYSGKFLEYLGSGTPILVCPPDEDVLAKTLAKTGAGLIANSPKEVVTALERMMNLDLPLRHEDVVKTYSREVQIKKLAKFFDAASQGRQGMS